MTPKAILATSEQDVKIHFVKDQIRKVLQANKLCCCSADGSFICGNCGLILGLVSLRDYACPNCVFGKHLGWET